MAATEPKVFTNEIPLKDSKENKLITVQWQVDIPVVIFSYKLKQGEKEILLEQRFAYDSMLEKFGIKKEESDANCPDKIIQALDNCFKSNKVFFNIGKRPDYSIEFRNAEDKTIFCSFLEPRIKTFQAVHKDNPELKSNIQYEIDIPFVRFYYTDENNVIHEQKFDYKCMFEKLGLQQKEEDLKNGVNLTRVIDGYFYQKKVLFETYKEFHNTYFDIEFRREDDTTLFKVFFKPKMNVFPLELKDSNDNKKYNIEWVIDIPNVIFNYKENKDGKEVIYKGQLDYSCTFEKFGVKKEEKDLKNPQGLTAVIQKYFDDGKVIFETYKEYQNIYYDIEFKGEENKTLFKVFLKP